MSGNNDFFGWDLLYKTIENQIVREADIIIGLVHWALIKNYSFRCLGVGDDRTIGENDIETENLPNGWNDSGESYALRYVFEGKLFILLAVNTSDVMVLNILDTDSKNLSNMSVQPKEEVKTLKGSIQTIIPNVSQFLDKVKKELVEPVFNGPKKEATTQTITGNTSFSTSSLPGRHHEDLFGRANPNFPGSINPFGNIGRGDLDPLGRGGGGMIFPGPSGFRPLMPQSPFGPGNRLIHPPPPGARFDPFGPLDPDRQQNPNPNNDHIRPPPDYDDMFM